LAVEGTTTTGFSINCGVAANTAMFWECTGSTTYVTASCDL
jgi:hypothetical protein